MTRIAFGLLLLVLLCAAIRVQAKGTHLSSRRALLTQGTRQTTIVKYRRNGPVNQSGNINGNAGNNGGCNRNGAGEVENVNLCKATLLSNFLNGNNFGDVDQSNNEGLRRRALLTQRNSGDRTKKTYRINGPVNQSGNVNGNAGNNGGCNRNAAGELNFNLCGATLFSNFLNGNNGGDVDQSNNEGLRRRALLTQRSSDRTKKTYRINDPVNESGNINGNAGNNGGCNRNGAGKVMNVDLCKATLLSNFLNGNNFGDVDQSNNEGLRRRALLTQRNSDRTKKTYRINDPVNESGNVNGNAGNNGGCSRNRGGEVNLDLCGATLLSNFLNGNNVEPVDQSNNEG